jgi:TonB family protein
MTTVTLNQPLGLDSWGIVSDADRRFRKVATVVVALFIALAILVPFLNLAGLQSGGGDTIERRYVSLMPEAEVADQVEEPKPAEEEQKQAAEEPKPQPVKKPEPAKQEPTREQQIETAREKAAQTGVMAMADQLKALRDNSLSGLDMARPLSSDVVTAKAGTGATGGAAGGAIANSAAASSGGISGAGTGEQRRSESGAGLGQRRTTTVQSPIGAGPDRSKPGQSGDKVLAARTLEEIQLTFDRNKAAFYALYTRAVRDNPNLRGKVIVSLTIAPNGSVTDCRIVSSELGDPDLEAKIVQRVKLLNFGAKNVPAFTYPNYPLTFFPA